MIGKFGVENDERIIMHDRGKGRDIGQNPTFVGVRPRTRTDTHNAQNAVGSYGERNEQVTSFAATAIGFTGGVSQGITSGSGALKGVTVEAIGGPARIRLRNGQGGVILFTANLDAGTSATHFFGDHGINCGGLYLEVLTGTDLAGSVWIASTE